MPENPANRPIEDLSLIKPKALRWSRRGGSRVQVFALWILLLVLWTITRSAQSWRILELMSLLVLGFFLMPFVQGPYLLYRKASRPLRADYRLWAGEIKPDFPQHRLDHLFSLGFTYAGQLVKEPGVTNVATFIAIFIHPKNRDSAQLVQVVSGLGTTPGLVFKSRFNDGFAFETGSFSVAPIFQPDPQFPVFRFPDVRSTHDLYRLHCKIKEQFSYAHIPTIADAEGELAEFIARAEIVNHRHVNSADYKLSPARDRYVYTCRGAIRHAWLRAWPIKSLRIIRMHRNSLKIAEQLGLPIDPKFGRIERHTREPWHGNPTVR
jgi:hypothetical protein